MYQCVINPCPWAEGYIYMYWYMIGFVNSVHCVFHTIWHHLNCVPPWLFPPSLSLQVTVVQNVHHNASLGSLVPADEREPILASYFGSYVKRLHANTDHLFSEEYEVLSIKAPSLPHQASLLPYNVEKNRYGNINSCTCFCALITYYFVV